MKRRGFTLTELVIVMTLSAIVLLSVSSMLIFIQRHSHARDASAAANSELTLLQTQVRAWFSDKDTSEYPAPQVAADGSLVLGEDSIRFENQILTLTTDGASVTQVYSLVTEVQFAVDGNLVKYTVAYQAGENESRVCSFMLLKKSVNAAEGESAVV